MHRMAKFFISKNLQKPEKIPNHRQWKVAQSDRCTEGPILLYIRAKGWFFDRVSQPALRYCVLTKGGFLLIYMKDDKGFVLDIRRAFQIKSLSDSVSVLKSQYRRCRIKIRYTFGTVNIILTNKKIDMWRDHLLNATDPVTRQLSLQRSDSNCTPLRPVSSGPLDDAEVSPSLVALKSFSSCSDKEAPRKENWAKVKTPTREQSETCVTCVDVSTCDTDYQCLSSRLEQIDDEDTVAETSMSGLFNHNSIRESDVPVGWLRRQLEHKIGARCNIYLPPAMTSSSTTSSAASPVENKIDVSRRRNIYVRPAMASSTTTSSVELPQMPLLDATIDQTAVSKAPKSKKEVKFSKKQGKSPMKATAKSVPSDSSNCEITRFNSFQFWRSSIFESDV